ncbi:MAG: hypothetical protein B6I20_01205 [Bacteroidetes bacterium 4572_117]|nr:MAG: hypothetical protein B6I20_01205 [Bacteroidetes bacterium 4572_117]
MKHTKIIFTAVLFLAAFFAFTYMPDDYLDKEKAISIEEAISSGIVEAEFQGTGTYSGDAINLELKSLISIDTLIKIEAGRRLVSDDTMLQDILIVTEMELFLAANEIKKLKLFGFCCQASKGAPRSDSNFGVGGMADSTLVVLARFLAKSNLPLNVMQNAIWAISDNNSLNSIHNENDNDRYKMKALFQLLAGLKGIEYEYPWYSLKYKTDTARVFSGEPIKLFAELEYNLSHQSNVDIFIKDANDLLVKKIFMNRPHHRGEYNYRFTLDVENMPKGKYYLRLYADNQLKLLKMFEL